MSVTSDVGGFAAADAGALALQWLESVRTALLLVDRELHVHWANPLALKWLSAKEPLSQVRKQLHLGRSQQQLRTLLRKADDDLEGICIPIDGRGAHLIVSARRITKSREAPFYGLVARRSDDMDTRLLGVHDAFRLTAAEGRRRVYALDPGPLRTIDEWLAHYRAFWRDALEEFIAQVTQSE